MKSIARISWTGIIASVGIGTLLALAGERGRRSGSWRGKHRSGDRCAAAAASAAFTPRMGSAVNVGPAAVNVGPAATNVRPAPVNVGPAQLSVASRGSPRGNARRLREERRIRHLHRTVWEPSRTPLRQRAVRLAAGQSTVNDPGKSILRY